MTTLYDYAAWLLSYPVGGAYSVYAGIKWGSIETYSWGAWGCSGIKTGILEIPEFLNWAFWNSPAMATSVATDLKNVVVNSPAIVTSVATDVKYIVVNAPAAAQQATYDSVAYVYNTSTYFFWRGYDGVMWYPKWSYHNLQDIAPGEYGKAFVWGLTNGAVWSLMLWGYNGVLESHILDWGIE